jgi:transcriptional regulator with XRE-family HTH domain
MTFAEFVRAVRGKKKQTQGQAAEAMGLTPSAVSRWEAGAEPKAKHLLRVKQWSGVAADKLLKLVGVK